LALVVWITIFCAVGYGQGTVLFANKVTDAGVAIVDAPFYDEHGLPLAGARYAAQLYIGIPEITAYPEGLPVPFQSNGYFDGGFFGEVDLIGIAPGASVWVQVRAWDTTGGTNFEKAALAGAWTGLSEVLLVRGIGGFTGGPPFPPSPLVGLKYPGSPVLVREPRSQTVMDGERATLSAIASSGVKMFYQWFKQPNTYSRPDGWIPDATDAVLTTEPLHSTTTFWLTISNVTGMTISERAVVTVLSTLPKLSLSRISGVPELRLDGDSSAAYTIEYKSDLNRTNWTTLAEVVPGTNGVTVLDKTATNAAVRFYRAVAR